MSLKLLDPHTNVQGGVRELQGQTVSLLDGDSAATKIDLAAIRLEDTVQSVLHYTAGAPLADLTSEVSISDTRATGTITLASVLAGDFVEVDGQRFEAIDGETDGANSGRANTGVYKFGLGANDDEAAANLKAAMEQFYGFQQPTGVNVSVLSNVVTVQSRVEGAAGNATTLVESTSGARITLSGATLAGGTDTGGIELSTTDTTGDQLVVTWYNKR
jgi:hypothetical protein